MELEKAIKRDIRKMEQRWYEAEARAEKLGRFRRDLNTTRAKIIRAWYADQVYSMNKLAKKIETYKRYAS